MDGSISSLLLALPSVFVTPPIEGEPWNPSSLDANISFGAGFFDPRTHTSYPTSLLHSCPLECPPSPHALYPTRLCLFVRLCHSMGGRGWSVLFTAVPSAWHVVAAQ